MILSTLRTQIKWILGVFIAIFVLSVFFTYDFGGGRSESEGPGADYAVANIGGQELRLSQLHMELRNYLERTGSTRDLKEEDMPRLYQIVLDDIVMTKALNDEVRRLKISASEEEVQAQLKLEEARHITKEAFMQNLRAQGITIKQVEASIAHELAISKLLADATAAVTVPDEEVRSAYDTLKTIPYFGLTRPAGLHADVARVRTASVGEALVKALKDGTAWTEALKTVDATDLISATTAEDPGHFANTDLPGDYEFIAKLADGETGGPVELASDNFLVVHRIEAVPEKVTPYEEAEPMIRQMLLQERRQEETRKYIEGLTSKIKVEILAPDLFPKPEEAAAPAEPQPAAEAAAPADTASVPASEQPAGAQDKAAPAETTAPAEQASTASTEAPVTEQPAAVQDASLPDTASDSASSVSEAASAEQPQASEVSAADAPAGLDPETSAVPEAVKK